MTRFFITAVLVFFALVSFCQPEKAQLDSLVSRYADMNRFNGVVLVAKGGTILLNKGYGYRNVAGKIANDENSIFQLGSITKQFTTAVILKLQQEKKLSLNDKLSKYFPRFPKADSITIEQLMLHTSGIYSYTNDPKFMETEVSKPANREKMMALFKDRPLDFSPGKGWNYSNSGYSMLGYIIEKVAKMPYEQAVRKYIFTPLQMTHSGFDFTHLQSPEKTTGYFKIDKTGADTAPIVDSSVSFSAGAIYSTVGDIYKWHQALENYTILSRADQEKAYTPVRNNYGYGWVIGSVEGKKKVGHGGGIHGYITNFTRVPEDDICIVLLSNASDKSLEEITDKILKQLYNRPYDLPKQRLSIALPEASLKQYEGSYEIRPDLKVVMSVKDGTLNATPTNQSVKVLSAEKEDFFFDPVDDVQVEFVKNFRNEVEGLLLYQGGRKIFCRKLKE
ncbi:MAG: serine hydrolase [Chitinophagaceae bacterium]|nr:serine hydrolase [Chitinophagaceae bacterium]